MAINIDPDQNDDVPEWRTKNGYTFPVLLADSTFARVNYGVVGTPTTLLLNADGKLVFRHLSYGPGHENTIETEVRELLGLQEGAGPR